MKHLAIIMAVFLLMGCKTTDSIPTKTAPKSLVKFVNLIQEKQEKEPKKEETPVVSVPKYVECAPGDAILKGLEKGGEKPIALWKDMFYGHQVIAFVNQETGMSTIIEYPPLFKGELACILSIGIETVIMVEPKTQGIKIRYLTN